MSLFKSFCEGFLCFGERPDVCATGNARVVVEPDIEFVTGKPRCSTLRGSNGLFEFPEAVWFFFATTLEVGFVGVALAAANIDGLTV